MNDIVYVGLALIEEVARRKKAEMDLAELRTAFAELEAKLAESLAEKNAPSNESPVSA
jgi:hypothetical protein